jgi:hypothetical protein
MKLNQVVRPAGFLFGLLTLAPFARSTVTGTLRITSDPGDLMLKVTSLDWTPPAGTPNGRFTIGAGTNLTYDAGTPLAVSSGGTILDLQASSIPPLPDFMTFDAAPGLRLELTLLSPGPANTVCAAALNANLPACAPAAGSPFALQPTDAGTTVTLSARGVARDNTAGASTFLGIFVTRIIGKTPAQVQANILAGGFERSTYSAEFAITGPSGAPPAIGKAFAPSMIASGGTSVLTFTITNPNASTPVTAIGFTDNLPAGVVVATPAGVSGSCGGTVTAVAGSSAISLADASLTANSFCMVRVNVLGITAGLKNNITSAVASNLGSGNTAQAALTVTAAPVLTKTFGASEILLNQTATLQDHQCQSGNTNRSCVYGRAAYGIRGGHAQWTHRLAWWRHDQR